MADVSRILGGVPDDDGWKGLAKFKNGFANQTRNITKASMTLGFPKVVDEPSRLDAPGRIGVP